jgi:predicted transcriptional regulator
MGKISDGLQRAIEAQFTRKPPVSTQARAKFLVKQYGGTRAVAELLGVSQRTVERYLTGQRRTPPPALAARLDAEVRRRWQPLVRRRATRRAATTTGITIETRATFGYDAPAGTTDEGRLRRITQHLPAAYAERLFEANEAGASDAELARIVADGFAEHYFRDGGRRAQGLDVRLTGIDYLDADF